MSIASEIERLQTAKQGIIESIRNKGIVVPDNVSLSDCATFIDAISGGLDCSKLEIGYLSSISYIEGLILKANNLTSTGSYRLIQTKNAIPLSNTKSFESRTRVLIRRLDSNKANGIMCNISNMGCPSIQYSPSNSWFIGIPTETGQYWYAHEKQYVPYDIQLNVWYDLVLIYKPDGTLFFSVNGEELCNIKLDFAPYFKQEVFSIGSNWDGGYFLRGDMDLKQTYIKVDGNVVWGCVP